MTPDLSISIVDTDNRDQTLDCVRSVFAATHRASLEVFVVDNACTDGSAEALSAEFPGVGLIRNTRREGFSTNNNAVLAQAGGRYLMLLNDDTLVQDGAFDRMVEFMDAHLEVGVAGANLFSPEGTRQVACDYPPGPLYDALRPLSTWLRPVRCSEDAPTEVGSVCGACLLVRREAAIAVGLLDTQFDPLYSEEVEWCYRISRAGWKIYHLPGAKVVHFGSQTMNRAPLHKLDRLYEKKALFFRKHGGPAAVWTFKIALLLSSVAKTAAWTLALPFRPASARPKIAAHRHVVRRALFL